MCGRFYIDTDEESLEQIIDELQRRQGQSVKTGEICPSDAAPVIANSRALTPKPFLMRWGYSLGGRLVINARSESAAQSPLFSDGMRYRRCLIPASFYFEWERRGKEKIRYAIRPQSHEPMYMAGIYRIEQNGPAFTILTRAPGEEISFIHDRMPVILPTQAQQAWLSPDASWQDLLEQATLRMDYGAM